MYLLIIKGCSRRSAAVGLSSGLNFKVFIKKSLQDSDISDGKFGCAIFCKYQSLSINLLLPEVINLASSSLFLAKPFQGGDPVNISNATQPTLQISAGFPNAFFITTSGASQ